MGISQTTSAIMVFLAGLLPASCHKTAPPAKSPSSAIVMSNQSGVVSLMTTATHATNMVIPITKVFTGNIGEITLTNHTETCLQFADGQNCILTPKMLDRNTVRITVTIESKNDYGETHNFAATQIVGKPGKPMEVAVGDLNLTFTPQIVADN